MSREFCEDIDQCCTESKRLLLHSDELMEFVERKAIMVLTNHMMLQAEPSAEKGFETGVSDLRTRGVRAEIEKHGLQSKLPDIEKEAERLSKASVAERGEYEGETNLLSDRIRCRRMAGEGLCWF